MTLPIELGTARKRREAEAAYIEAATFVAMSFAASNFESVPRNLVPRWMGPRARQVVDMHVHA